MVELCDGCIDHLEAALQATDHTKKNYHIREVLQACETAELPPDQTVELAQLNDT
ncbi:hypothetical protein [Halobacterium salinarum]|uniref:Uncharacterized protein n=3 Tax=Halobacterium salinarum TaxID=2242 RepID=Q9HQ14_HALSA|nr:hypothetical protein [Halobacterium salinarum]AAG19703.1 hypothetical protein VNG_1376H [Halobacterium salinarum NRC-1]MBB6088705.1 hypothetical protein [Halobacterium salinarum]MDL0118887.1 hypothetical protein [Halobacterium salinarum]MDL0129999.1 hypothetical protein [Halobacterium salinarum]MDL0142258.1 hypothetical protein [Halobacterium salinarum]